MTIHEGSSATREPDDAQVVETEPVRPWPRIVHATQALGPNEQMFAALHQFTATNVTRVIALEGALAPREIRQALRALQARHPLLRARIVAGARPHFVYDSAPPLPLHVIARRDDQHFREVLERLVNKPLEHDPGPLFEVHYVYGERTRRAELIVVGEHAACDGISINSLCTELLELCARGLPRPPRRRLGALDSLLPRSAPALQARSFGGALVKFARVALSRALHERRPSAHTSAYAFRNLSSEQTSELVAAARAEATTVTGALMAAALLAVREVRPHTPRLALSVPINLRPRVPGHELAPEDLGNLTGVAYLESRGQGELWELARTMKTQLDETAESDALLAAVSLIYRAGKLFVRPGQAPLAHAMVSNSSVVPLRRDYGAFRPVGFYSATSAPMISADFAFFCNTFDGKLCINLVYAGEVVPRAEAERVLSLVHAHLVGA